MYENELCIAQSSFFFGEVRCFRELSFGYKMTDAASGRNSPQPRRLLSELQYRSGHNQFQSLQRNVTICALVQSASGLNVSLPVPFVTFSLTAHRTASQ